MAYTRLGPFGYSGRNYGAFTGKEEAAPPLVTVKAATDGSGHRRKRRDVEQSRRELTDVLAERHIRQAEQEEAERKARADHAREIYEGLRAEERARIESVVAPFVMPAATTAGATSDKVDFIRLAQKVDAMGKLLEAHARQQALISYENELILLLI
jgi:hypothetical protein